MLRETAVCAVGGLRAALWGWRPQDADFVVTGYTAAAGGGVPGGVRDIMQGVRRTPIYGHLWTSHSITRNCR